MIDKKWLIKIKEDLWYDSEKKEYRYRIHCPNCGKVSGCLCYSDLEEAEIDICNDVGFCCSSKCSIICGEFDDLNLVMSILDIKKDVDELSEEDCEKIHELLLEGADFDLPVGKLCKN